MRNGPDIAGLAALLGEPARTCMLEALMSGCALTAGELAAEAGVSAQTASGHLARMIEAGLVSVEARGRHRYHRIAGPPVAQALEGLMVLASGLGRLRTRPGPRDAAMRLARVCYDHLAGALGVRLHEALLSQGLIVATADGFGISARGRLRFIAEGIDLPALDRRSRPLCRSCLDWSERRHHLAGALGAELLQLFLRRGWARRETDSRTIRFDDRGRTEFEAFLSRPPAAPRLEAL